MSNTNHINDGGPAFPRDSKWNLDGSFCQRGAVGMSLRDWFAGQALIGMIQNEDDIDFSSAYEAAAKISFKLADAMIAARNNQTK